MIQLQPTEHILFVSRRHWWIFFILILKLALVLIVLGGGLVALRLFYPASSGYVSLELLTLLGMLVLEFSWTMLFLAIVDFYLDAWVVTDERLIFVEVQGLFSRTVNSVDYRNIQDISISIHGIIPTFLNFGDITIQSAGTHGRFEFRQVPNPNAVKERILGVRNEFLKRVSS